MTTSLNRSNIKNIAFSLYWAWMSITFFSPAIYAEGPSVGAFAQAAWLCMAGSATILRLVHIAARKKLPRLAINQRLLVTAIILSTIGSTLIPAGSYLDSCPKAALFVSMLGGVLCGFGACWGTIMWGEVYEGKDTEEAFGLISITFVAACIIHFVVIFLPRPLPLICAALCNAISLWCANSIEKGRCAANEKTTSKVSGKIGGRLLIPLLAIFLYASCGEIFHTFLALPGEAHDLLSMGTWYTLGGGIGSLLLALVMTAFKSLTKSPGDSLYLYAVLVLMAAGVMTPVVLPVSYHVAYCIFGAAFWCFRNIVWAYSTNITTRTNFPPVAVFSVSQLMFSSAILIGSPVFHEVASRLQLGSMSWTTISLIIVFFVLAIALALSCSEGSFWGLIPETPTNDSNLDNLSEKLSQEYFLSPRECEFAILLSRGRSLPYIQKKLFISEGTAKSHLKNVYRKLNVHSKQEFLDTVEELESGKHPKS